MGWQLGREVENEKNGGLEYEFMGSQCKRETFTCAETVWGKKKILVRKVEVLKHGLDRKSVV